MLLNISALSAILRVFSFAGPQTQEAGPGVFRAPALHHTKEQEFTEVQTCSGCCCRCRHTLLTASQNFGSQNFGSQNFCMELALNLTSEGISPNRSWNVSCKCREIDLSTLFFFEAKIYSGSIPFSYKKQSHFLHLGSLIFLNKQMHCENLPVLCLSVATGFSVFSINARSSQSR